MTVQTWLWIGTFGMAIGALALFFPLQKSRTASELGDSIGHFIVPIIALTLYLLMALGHGSVVLASGRTFYYGRYIDWTFTTPILLLSLVSSAVDGHKIKRGALIAGLLLSDVYMIETGFVAAGTDDPSLKWWFYTMSCVSFIAIYAILWGPFRRLSLSSSEPEKGANFRKKLPILTLLWLGYPIVFIVGQEGLRLWSPLIDGILFTSLDLIAKVAYGLYGVSLAKSVPVKEKDLLEGGGEGLANAH